MPQLIKVAGFTARYSGKEERGRGRGVVLLATLSLAVVFFLALLPVSFSLLLLFLLCSLFILFALFFAGFAEPQRVRLPF